MCPKHQKQYWAWLDNDKPLVPATHGATWASTHAIVCQQVDAIKRECREGLTCGTE